MRDRAGTRARASGASGTATSFTTTAATAGVPAGDDNDAHHANDSSGGFVRADVYRAGGMIINAVRPERVADFEKLIGYLKVALASSTDTTVRAQAEGWRVLKASETGPNGAVLYVFLFDPTVPGADYGLGRILAAAFPDQTKLQEVWKLYTDSLATGGSLLNLTPVEGTPPGESKDSPLPEKSQDAPLPEK